MARILYSAKTSTGEDITGFVQADSNDTALQSLQEKGYTDVHFHLAHELMRDDAFASLDKLDPQEIRKVSRRLIRNQKRTPFIKKWNNVIRLVQLPLGFGLFVFLFGFAFNIPHFDIAAIVAAMVVFTFLYFFWYRIVISNEQYSKVIELTSYGKFQQADNLIDKTLANAPTKVKKTLVPDLTARKACLIARQQTLAQGLSYFELMKSELSDVPQWQFDYFRARVHAAVNDSMGYLVILRKTHKKVPDKQILSLDLAATETRYGELDIARQLLKAIDMKTLPQIALPFVDYVRGLIARKSRDTTALDAFSKAYQGMMKYKNNPNSLQLLALMAGFYSLALLDANNAEQAETIARAHWAVLRHLPDHKLIQELKDRLPVLNSI